MYARVQTKRAPSPILQKILLLGYHLPLFSPCRSLEERDRWAWKLGLRLGGELLWHEMLPFREEKLTGIPMKKNVAIF